MPKMNVKSTDDLGDKPETFMTSMEAVLYKAGLEGIDRQRVQHEYDDALAREESKKLSHMSRLIASTWDLLKLLAKLQPGQSIAIDYDGNVFKGRVKTEKLQPLPHKFAVGRQVNPLDVGQFQHMRTSSSVSSPSPAFKNAWNNMKIPSQPKKDEFPLHISVELFFLEMDMGTLTMEDITVTPVKYLSYDFVEYSTEKMPGVVLGIYPPTGSLRYYKIDGKLTEL
jgi:hypothetical protein